MQSPANKGHFKYFLFITTMNGMLGNLVGYFLPIYFKDLGYSGFYVGLFYTIASISNILMSLPMGVSTDRFSIALIIMISFFLMGLSKLGFVISTSFMVFCLFSFIGSFGGKFYGTATGSMFYKMAGAGNYKAAAAYQFFNFFGSGCGMLIGSLIIAGYSYKSMFLMGFITNWVLMVLSFFLPRNETVIIKAAEYKKAVMRKEVLYIAFIFSVASIHWGAESVSYGQFLRNNLMLSAKQIGLYTSTGFWMVGVGALLGSFLLKRGIIKNLQALLVISYLLSGVFHILMTTNTVWLSYLCRIGHEIGDGLMFIFFYHGITKAFKLDKIGGCSSFIGLCQMVTSLLSGMAFGYMGDTFGYQWPFIISGAALSLLPVLLLVRKNDVVSRQLQPM